VIDVARTLEELIAHGEVLAEKFESDHDRSMFREPSTRSRLALAAMRRSLAERDLRHAVVEARGEGLSWDQIGEVLGVSGEAARKRYAKVVGDVADARRLPEPARDEEAGKRSTALSVLTDDAATSDPSSLERVRELVLVLHREAQGAETARFEESLNRLLDRA
jgi:hypothetical protein